jgi:hypothetical protein
MSHDAHHHSASDSAGQPWAGREFEPNAWSDDDGTTPTEYFEAITAFRRTAPASSERAVAHISVVDAVRTNRFLIPLLAEAGEVGVNAAGVVVDKTQELAIVTVEGPGGQRVLPVFSSVAAMAAWRPDARPVPAEGRRVALAAAGDGAQWIVIDPTSPTEIVLRRPERDAIAQGNPWAPNRIDPKLTFVMEESIAGEEHVQGIRLGAGDADARGFGEDLVVELLLTPSLSQEELAEIVRRLSQRWAEEPIFSERIDSMRLTFTPATPAG